ncbi:HutD protein [Clostridium acidisoli DSM 12555]|uniref:HutD protein n=1 Tax=Clostridium acidisoli DSM 12555 TaxID=1121291 RepID=A0A1W1WXW2_9CLOT|nr:HutD family protein [Clostridium acidisoli]SMC16484.1 HutD protein [Clostridium acidisoli DSM 12555]
MKYNVTLLKQKNYKPTFWSGGMATELTTYPLNSDYASKNFLWRLGVAKIDIDESTFTNLPNISRKLMVIDGKITLDHENKYKKTLTSFEQDAFMGDLTTKTYGQSTVFNLMTRENYDGDLLYLSLKPNSQLNFEYKTPPNKNLETICFYTVSGSFKCTIYDKVLEAASKDLILIKNIVSSCNPEVMLSNTALVEADIIVSIIYKN